MPHGFFSGMQQDPNLLNQLCQTYGNIQVIIDDASHQQAHIKATFKGMFPCMIDDSFYIVEDMYEFYREGCLKKDFPQMSFFKNMIDDVNIPVHDHLCNQKSQRTAFGRNRYSIRFYTEWVMIHKKDNTLPFPMKGLISNITM